jgi:glycine dehydrogenase subunit 1
MRYLPLSEHDRGEMLAAVGVPDVGALFVDVPEAARLSGPIAGLPGHASEMAVERHMARLSAQSLTAGEVPFSSAPGPIATMFPPRLTT